MNPTIEPVRKNILVQVPQEQAFTVFSKKMDLWWPPTHKIGASDLKTVILEPKTGGRWYEVGTDGSECEWGKVLVWDPPRRLVLAWQLSGHWKYDPNLITEVEVNFVSEGAAQTRVTLEHRYIERFGESARPARVALDSPGGWGGMLEHFARVAAQ